VNKSKLKRKSKEIDLAAALDQSVEAADYLRISENDLVAQLLERAHSKAISNVVPLRVDLQRKMYNPEAGP